MINLIERPIPWWKSTRFMRTDITRDISTPVRLTEAFLKKNPRNCQMVTRKLPQSTSQSIWTLRTSKLQLFRPPLPVESPLFISPLILRSTPLDSSRISSKTSSAPLLPFKREASRDLTSSSVDHLLRAQECHSRSPQKMAKSLNWSTTSTTITQLNTITQFQTSLFFQLLTVTRLTSTGLRPTLAPVSSWILEQWNG